VRGGSAEWMIWMEVLCLADIDVSSAKSEVCDLKKKENSMVLIHQLKLQKQGDINKSAKIKRRMSNIMLPRS
jgi:hypothetical protein